MLRLHQCLLQFLPTPDQLFHETDPQVSENPPIPSSGIGGFSDTCGSFHGKADQVLEEIAKGIDVTGASVGIERSIINLVVDSKGILTFYLGKPVAITGGKYVGGNDCGRSVDHDSSPSIIQGKGTRPEC